MKGFMAGALLALGVASCAIVPTTQEQAAADYGTPMEQAEAEAAAEAHIKARLKDPGSAVFTWKPIYAGYLRGAPIVGRKTIYGYLLDGTVNAKNSFGGYTGAEPYQVIFRNGVIVHVANQQCLATGGCYMAPMD